ncbi:MAG: nuclease, partial [Bacteroidia bacterium]|nr:nuclease [Bacteroidia bacterium]
NLVMQDATGGIVIRFTSANIFNLGDSIEVNLSGDSLVSFSGVTQVNYATFASVNVISTGVSVAPRTATISQILANQNAWESTLLKIVGTTLSGGGTYGSNSGNVTMTDASGSMELFTRSGASFAGTTYPTTTVSVTGYLSHFNSTPELMIRATTDVQ